MALSEEPESRLDEILKSHDKIRTRYVEGEEAMDILEDLLATSDAEVLDKAHLSTVKPLLSFFCGFAKLPQRAVAPSAALPVPPPSSPHPWCAFQAMEILDPYGDGLVTFDELKLAVRPGEALRAMMDARAEEAEVAEGAEEEEQALEDFVLSLAPEGESYAELAKAGAHKKAKAKNGCRVLEGCHAYLECHTVSILDAGNYSLVYAEVTSGKVLDEKVKTDIRSVLESSGLVGFNLQEATQASRAPAVPAMAALPASPQTRPGSQPPGAFAGRAKKARAARGARTALAARGGEERDVEMSEIQSWTGLTPGKEYRLQTMSIEEVAEDTSTIRSLDWDRDRFDIEFRLERGTTYNSYVIKGAEKTALVDTSHEKFEDLYIAALRKEVDLSALDYLIVSHTEPDHSGLIGKVLELAEQAGNEKLEVIGSKMCIAYLETRWDFTTTLSLYKI